MSAPAALDVPRQARRVLPESAPCPHCGREALVVWIRFPLAERERCYLDCHECGSCRAWTPWRLQARTIAALGLPGGAP